jgi:ADP-dependent NAD(P)H-hydrate dehydratase / NAD(P)H-hydrate epimerase
MAATYWHKQSPDNPLFPDLLWSRPENKNQAGKLLIIGGNAHGFAAPAEAYSEANKAGIGTARVLLPDSLQKAVGKVFEAGEYAPSTPSGSFSQKALAEFLALSEWAEGLLLAGDLGRNSETAILLEKFIEKYDGQLTVTQDALDYFIKLPQTIVERPGTLLVASFSQLQKIAANAGSTKAFTFDMDFLRLIDGLHELTERFEANIIIRHHKNFFTAVNGEVSTTSKESEKIWRVPTAAHASVWWLQNPSKTFEALTTGVVS